MEYLYATIKTRNMEKIKAVQIGYGRWGKRLALTAEKFCALSIADRESFEKHLVDPGVQAVIIATPINTHYEIAKRALEAHKDVFLEKPGTDSSEKLGELIAIAKRNDLIFQIGYEFAYANDVEEMKNAVESGSVKKISFVWNKWGTFETHPVINLLVHELSILKAIGVWPIEITKYEEVKGEHNLDSIRVEAKANEISITFDIDRASEIKEKIVTLETDKGKQEWRDGRTPLVEEEIKAFINSIVSRRTPITDGNFAKEILEAIEKIPYRS
jgi:predicted dehydrogenase